jgi:alkylhydroperoxidase/carboxymuconolactone decarboxylase family protein YurZ
MSDAIDKAEALKGKYGARAIENGLRLEGETFAEALVLRDKLDQHYTKVWLDFIYGGMYRRGVLDDATRTLAIIGQCIVVDEMTMLEDYLRTFLTVGGNPRAALEVILQATIYAGNPRVSKALTIFDRVVEDAGQMDQVTRDQLPLEGKNPGRSLETERATWGVKDEDWPRRDELMEQYGWYGISSGLRLAPTHHVHTVENLDRLDQNFLQLWLDYIYAGMYPRQVIDDRTRLLCMIGETIVMGELSTAENHMRCALILGATPREIMEVILQATIFAGMPRSLKGAWSLEKILAQQGRVAEITETQLPQRLPE